MDRYYEVLSRQRGVIDRQQCFAAGLAAKRLDHKVARGELIRLHAGVYRHAAFPVTYEQRLVAGLRAAGPRSAISHRAAVAMWGLRRYSSSLVELSRQTGWRCPPNAILIHTAADLEDRWLRHRDGIRLTSPARTLVDLGAVASEHLVVRCLEEWLADRVVTLGELREAIALHQRKGRAGPRVMRTALATRVLVDSVPDSGYEARLAAVLVARGVPRPTHHHEVRAPDGRLIAELDFAYPDQRVAIELDGYGVHLRSREIFEHDRRRQNELEILGWRVLRFAATQLDREPDLVADQVRRMLSC